MRRSNALTGAQWIATRFGTGRGATFAHLSVVFFARVNVVGRLADAVKGSSMRSKRVPLASSCAMRTARPELTSRGPSVLVMTRSVDPKTVSTTGSPGSSPPTSPRKAGDRDAGL